MVLTGSYTDKMGIWVALKNVFSSQGTKKQVKPQKFDGLKVSPSSEN